MRKVVAVVLALFFLLALALGSELAVSHYRRQMANKLLTTVRGLNPGTTTEAQAKAALKPFITYEEASERRRAEGVPVKQVWYQFYNLPEWASSAAYHLRFLPFRIAPPWTLFEVDLDFVDGFLEKIHVVEMQEDYPGFPHPNSASVSLFSTRFGAQPGPIPLDINGHLNFRGYSDHSQSSGQVDDKGNLTNFSCCHARFIVMDERATPAQVSQSLNFQLRCMTSFLRCKNDRQLLP